MILVTGATGRTGRELVKVLTAKGTPVRAMVHDPNKARQFQGLSVEVALGDLENPRTVEAALRGAEKVFLLSPDSPAMADRDGRFVEAAKRAGVRHIVRLSILVARPDSPLTLGQWHWSADRHVMDSGLPFTILKPAYFMQNLLAAAPMVKMKGVLPGAMGEGKVGLIDARDIAAAAATVLTSDGHAGNSYPLTGPEALSLGDAAAQLSAVLGREIRFANMAPDEAKAGMASMGMPEPIAAAWVQLAGMVAQGAANMVTPHVQEITGKAPRTFDQFAREFAKEFTA